MSVQKNFLNQIKQAEKIINCCLKELKAISISEAAKLRGVSNPGILDLIKRGKIHKVNIFDRTYVFKEEIKNLPRPRKINYNEGRI